MNGYVMIPRSFLENEEICRDSEFLAVYVYILSNACFKDRGYGIWGKNQIKLNKGQLVTSIRKISKDTKIPKTNVERILDVFKKWDVIGTEPNSRQTLISIDFDDYFKKCYGTKSGQLWDEFQEKQDEKEKRSKREKEEIKELNNKGEIDSLFERFWVAYPKKVGKGYAKACFFKLKVDEKLLDTMLNALEWQKNTRSWRQRDGKYIPNPSTWLNGARWQDEDYTVKNESKDGWGTYI